MLRKKAERFTRYSINVGRDTVGTATESTTHYLHNFLLFLGDAAKSQLVSVPPRKADQYVLLFVEVWAI